MTNSNDMDKVKMQAAAFRLYENPGIPRPVNCPFIIIMPGSGKTTDTGKTMTAYLVCCERSGNDQEVLFRNI